MPNPLGDAQDHIRRQVFGPRVALALPDAGVAAGQYGDATHVGQFTVGPDGRLTQAASVAISGGGGGGTAVDDASMVIAQRVFSAAAIAAASGLRSPLRAKGDIWVFSSRDDREPVGADNYVLKADSTQTTGVGWASIYKLSSFSGTTTSAWVTVFDISNASGLHGSAGIDNTDGTNALNYRWTVTGLGGTVVGTANTLSSGNLDFADFDDASSWKNVNIATGVTVPVTEVKLEVQDQFAGMHASYSVKVSYVP
jgi:hypothetical protein